MSQTRVQLVGNVSTGASFAGIVTTRDLNVIGVITAIGLDVSSGAILGIQSGGQSVGAGATTLNFIGAGNTFSYNAGTKTLDISIQGGGGGVSTTGILSCRGIANSALIFESLELDDSFTQGTNYAMVGPITITGSGTTVTVGAGVSYVIV